MHSKSIRKKFHLWYPEMKNFYFDRLILQMINPNQIYIPIVKVNLFNILFHSLTKDLDNHYQEPKSILICEAL